LFIASRSGLASLGSGDHPGEVERCAAGIQVHYETDPYRFVAGKRTLVVLQRRGAGEDQNFWMWELATGHQRQITELRRKAWV
jgi:hypothetical protein